jgi:hypothetical protein
LRQPGRDPGPLSENRLSAPPSRPKLEQGARGNRSDRGYRAAFSDGQTSAWKRSWNWRALVNPPAEPPDERKQCEGKGYALDQGAPFVGAGSWDSGRGNWGREHIDTSGKTERLRKTEQTRGSGQPHGAANPAPILNMETIPPRLFRRLCKNAHGSGL